MTIGIKSQSNSRKLYPKCHNFDSVQPKDIDLPDGHKDAVRVIVGRKNGKPSYSACCPWIYSANNSN